MKTMDIETLEQAVLAAADEFRDAMAHIVDVAAMVKAHLEGHWDINAIAAKRDAAAAELCAAVDALRLARTEDEPSRVMLVDGRLVGIDATPNIKLGNGQTLLIDSGTVIVDD